MARPPNIILLVGEDAGRSLGCYGDPDAQTPNLDRLAAEGVRFDNAFSTAPVCAPSRSALISGRYAWSTGAHHMRSELVSPPAVFTAALRAAGYYVNWEGKTDFNCEPATGWRDDDSPWIDDLEGGRFNQRPFFLFRNLFLTHESTMWPEPCRELSVGAVRDRLAAREYSPVNRHPDPRRLHLPTHLPDDPVVRSDLARFYEGLAHNDDEVGRILTALERSRQAANTLVIYLTDHGRGLPREKRWCYGAGLHLSLVMRWPAGLPSGSVRDDLVSWVDLAPTLLSLAGIAPPPDLPGRVFLGPAAAAPRDFVFAGRDRMDEAFDRVRVARDRQFHYICNAYPKIPYAQRIRYMEHLPTTRLLRERHANGSLPSPAALWLAPTKPGEELYDAIADPAMIFNLASKPSHRSVLQRLRSALDAELEAHGDLGNILERTLIADGVVTNVLDTRYAPNLAPLPGHLSPEIYRSRLTPAD